MWWDVAHIRRSSTLLGAVPAIICMLGWASPILLSISYLRRLHHLCICQSVLSWLHFSVHQWQPLFMTVFFLFPSRPPTPPALIISVTMFPHITWSGCQEHFTFSPVESLSTRFLSITVVRMSRTFYPLISRVTGQRMDCEFAGNGKKKKHLSSRVEVCVQTTSIHIAILYANYA